MVLVFEDIIDAMENRTCKNCKHWTYNDDKFAYRGSCAKMCCQVGVEFKPIYTDGDFVCLRWKANKQRNTMNDKVEIIKTSRRVLLPSMKIDKFDEIKEHVVETLDCYRNVEGQVLDMICVIRTRRNEDGTFTMYMGASPDNNLGEILLHEDANINSLTVNRKE